MEFVSFRFAEENKKLAEELAKLEGRDKSDEFRAIFLAGLAEKRREVALSKYSKSEVSIGKAAKIAGLSIWEFLELLQKKNIPLNLSADEIMASVGRI